MGLALKRLRAEDRRFTITARTKNNEKKLIQHKWKNIGKPLETLESVEKEIRSVIK